jgi:hypothetical protein
MKRLTDRRTFLRGLGVSLALPWLESVDTRGFAATGPAMKASPRRFACLFMANGVEPGQWGAQGDGPAMQLKSTLAPLESLKEDLLVLNGLYNPQALTGNIHLAAAPNVLSGAHVVPSTSDLMVGTSFDQRLAAELGGQTMFPSLVLGIEPPTLGTHKGYSCIYSGHISWSTPKTPIPRENHPRALYDRLVGDPRGMRKAKSALDLVLEDAHAILPRVSAWDRRRLEEYLSSVREVEQRLARLPEKAVRTGPRVEDLIQPPDVQEPPVLADHMRLMLDLLTIAVVTDSTRAATMMFNNDLSRMDFGFLRSGSSDLTNMHGMSHAGGPDYALMNRFHIEMYAHLLKRLYESVEGEQSVLDNSCIMFCSSLMSGGAHDRTQMPVLLAGKLGGTLKTGRTLTYDRAHDDRRRLCNLYSKLSECYGLKSRTFGDSIEPLCDL